MLMLEGFCADCRGLFRCVLYSRNKVAAYSTKFMYSRYSTGLLYEGHDSCGWKQILMFHLKIKFLVIIFEE